MCVGQFTAQLVEKKRILAAPCSSARHKKGRGIMNRILSGVLRTKNTCSGIQPAWSTPDRIGWTKPLHRGARLLGIGIPNRGHRGMLRVPTHLRMAVTGARVPRVRVSARLRTRQPGAPGERLRHRHTHGGPPGGAPTGHEGERSSSIWLHDGGPVVRGTSSSGHRG